MSIKKTTSKQKMGPLGNPLGNPLGFFNSLKGKTKTEPKQTLRKAQYGEETESGDLINKAGSTGGYKKSMKKYNPFEDYNKMDPARAMGANMDNVNIANRNRLTEMQGQMVPDLKAMKYYDEKKLMDAQYKKAREKTSSDLKSASDQHFKDVITKKKGGAVKSKKK